MKTIICIYFVIISCNGFPAHLSENFAPAIKRAHTNINNEIERKLNNEHSKCPVLKEYVASILLQHVLRQIKRYQRFLLDCSDKGAGENFSQIDEDFLKLDGEMQAEGKLLIVSFCSNKSRMKTKYHAYNFQLKKYERRLRNFIAFYEQTMFPIFKEVRDEIIHRAESYSLPNIPNEGDENNAGHNDDACEEGHEWDGDEHDNERFIDPYLYAKH